MLYVKPALIGAKFHDIGTTGWRGMWSWAGILGMVWLA